MFYFHPYLGKISNLTSMFFRWAVQPPSSFPCFAFFPLSYPNNPRASQMDSTTRSFCFKQCQSASGEPEKCRQIWSRDRENPGWLGCIGDYIYIYLHTYNYIYIYNIFHNYSVTYINRDYTIPLYIYIGIAMSHCQDPY